MSPTAAFCLFCYALIATGCATGRAPIEVDGAIDGLTEQVGGRAELVVSALRRESTTVMGVPNYEDVATQSPRYVSYNVNADGSFSARVTNSKRLILRVTGFKLTRKDRPDAKPAESLTFSRSESGVQLEITPND
ncbi:MAG: hypothetical protein AAF711_03725 [Planctomycetota bacterium]